MKQIVNNQRIDSSEIREKVPLEASGGVLFLELNLQKFSRFQAPRLLKAAGVLTGLPNSCEFGYRWDEA